MCKRYCVSYWVEHTQTLYTGLKVAGVEGGGGWGEEMEREVNCGSAVVGAGTSDPMKECWGEGTWLTTE